MAFFRSHSPCTDCLQSDSQLGIDLQNAQPTFLCRWILSLFYVAESNQFVWVPEYSMCVCMQIDRRWHANRSLFSRHLTLAHSFTSDAYDLLHQQTSIRWSIKIPMKNWPQLGSATNTKKIVGPKRTRVRVLRDIDCCFFGATFIGYRHLIYCL